ncbi:hypothetical protein [Fundicoccus culcitae]|uniref:Uncharacterized protein n=1 Tax=Fundicoccus culcitae TaxID=2969821 RepID=A0ABY5P481_9LACT|nr:hypothetical protein [Fundicoccus culcitae]UUX33548.1 hypothetical protein NRE15_11665 [Fundicoccus culcitae]
MENQEINLLLERQFIIQDEIEKLSKESNEISLKIYQLNNKSMRPNITNKNEIKSLLESKGYDVNTKTQSGSQILVVSNNSKTLNVLLKQSKYYYKSYHAWYTINPNVEDFVDIFIFIYLDKYGISNSLVINKNKMQPIMESLSKMPDGRTNIQLTVENGEVIEHFSKVNLTDSVNDFSVFD